MNQRFILLTVAVVLLTIASAMATPPSTFIVRPEITASSTTPYRVLSNASTELDFLFYDNIVTQDVVFNYSIYQNGVLFAEDSMLFENASRSVYVNFLNISENNFSVYDRFNVSASLTDSDNNTVFTEGVWWVMNSSVNMPPVITFSTPEADLLARLLGTFKQVRWLSGALDFDDDYTPTIWYEFFVNNVSVLNTTNRWIVNVTEYNFTEGDEVVVRVLNATDRRGAVNDSYIDSLPYYVRNASVSATGVTVVGAIEIIDDTLVVNITGTDSSSVSVVYSGTVTVVRYDGVNDFPTIFPYVVRGDAFLSSGTLQQYNYSVQDGDVVTVLMYANNIYGSRGFYSLQNSVVEIFVSVVLDNETYNFTSDYVTVHYTPITGTIYSEVEILAGVDWIYTDPASDANVPATITFNVTSANLYPTRNGELCYDACSNIISNSTHLSFDVSGWSNYSYVNAPLMVSAVLNDDNVSMHWRNSYLDATCLATDADGDDIYYKYNITKDGAHHHSFWDDGYFQYVSKLGGNSYISGSFFEYAGNDYFLAGSVSITPTDIRYAQIVNNSVVTSDIDWSVGLVDGSSFYAPITVLEVDGVLRALQYDHSATGWNGHLSGYYWNTTAWVADVNFTGDLPNASHQLGLLELDDEVYFMYIDTTGVYYSYKWNGSSWAVDTTPLTGLTYVHSSWYRNAVQVFDYDGDIYTMRFRSLTSPSRMVVYLYNWSGSTWVLKGEASYVQDGTNHVISDSQHYLLSDLRVLGRGIYRHITFKTIGDRIWSYGSQGSSYHGFFSAPGNAYVFTQNQTNTVYQETDLLPGEYQLLCVAYDMQLNSDSISSNIFNITNIIPVASNLSILPVAASEIDLLEGSYVYYDVDGDPENGTTIKWRINGVVVLENSSVLASSYTNEGDVVMFEVIPKDGAQFGSSINITITVLTAKPEITALSCPTTYPNEDNLPSVEIIPVEISVVDTVDNFVNFSIAASVSFSNSSCSYTTSGSTRNYVCNLSLNYWQAADSYPLTVSVTNTNGQVIDTSEDCIVGGLLAMKRVTDAVGFSGAAPGLSDVRSDDAIVLRNTGNTALNIHLTAYDLVGVQYPSDTLSASSFKAGHLLSSSVLLDDGVQKDLAFNIPVGEQANDYFWLWLSMSSSQRIQDYKTTSPWQVVGLS